MLPPDEQLDALKPSPPMALAEARSGPPGAIVQRQEEDESSSDSASLGDVQVEPDETPLPALPEDVSATLDDQIEALLQEYLESWENIPVRVTGDDGSETIVYVRPPYIINSDERKETAEQTREDMGPEVEALITRATARANEIGGTLVLGKSSREDIQLLLEDAVRSGLVEPESEAMREFLNDLGVGVDCSGFVTRAYNMLNEELQLGEEELDVIDTGSLDYRGRSSSRHMFKRVEDGSELRPGYAMFIDRTDEDVPDHVRIIISVEVLENGDVEFTTGESSGSQDGPVAATFLWPDGGGPEDVVCIEGHADDSDDEVTFGAYRPVRESGE